MNITNPKGKRASTLILCILTLVCICIMSSCTKDEKKDNVSDTQSESVPASDSAASSDTTPDTNDKDWGWTSDYI